MPKSDGYKNLINLANDTEKAREIGKIGGVNSGIAKRKKKLLKETINEFLLAANPETGNEFQIDLVNKLIEQVLKKGDVNAFNSLRDTAGQKPKEDIQTVVMPVINIKGL